MEPVHYVGIAAQILTYASFLSGAKICQQIHRQKSSTKFSFAPFLAGLNCTVLWLRYGFIADEWEIIAVNSVGLVCQFIYITFFIAYSKQRIRLTKQLSALILFLSSLVWFIGNTADPQFLIGSLASFSSFLACASPLATIKDVLRTRCVASLPFPIIISGFIVSSSWLLFGYLKDDSFIVLSNLVAVSISGAQLALFAIYPSTMPYEKLSQSNKKSWDLIQLLNSEDSDQDSLDLDDINSEEIDTNQDYKVILKRILGSIYSKREKMTKSSGTVILLFLCLIS